jgi:hypothetical protein
MGILDTVGGSVFSTGLAGQCIGEPLDVETRVNEGATGIDFGGVVCRGTAVTPGTPGKCKVMASGAVVIGLARRARSEANADSSGVVTYGQYKEVPVVKDAWIWVKATENVTEGDDLIGVVADLTGAGGTTGGAANGTTRLAFPASAKWQQTVTTGNYGLVHVKCV